METYSQKRRLEAGESSSCSSRDESSIDKRPRLETDTIVMDIDSPLPIIELRNYSTDSGLHHNLSHGPSDSLSARDRTISPSLSLLDIASTASSQDQRSIETASNNDIDDGHSSSRSLFRASPWPEGKHSSFTHGKYLRNYLLFPSLFDR